MAESISVVTGDDGVLTFVALVAVFLIDSYIKNVNH